MRRPQQQEIRRRAVFYIPGYDPIPPRRYRELYRREGRRQAEISGYRLELAGRAPGQGGYGWHVRSTQDGAACETDVEVLVWSDIVRASMDHGIVRSYRIMARTAWIYISTGALRRLMRLRKGPVIAALYPVGMLILQLLLALLVGGLLGGLARWLAGFVPLHGEGGPGFAARIMPGTLVWWLVFLASVWGLLGWFRRIDNRLYVYYLMHDYAYSAATRGANPPELEARIAGFAARIGAALCSEVDEVLVVGHSSGAHLAVSVLADLDRAGAIPESGPRLGLLTLGQVVPMVSFLPDAWRLRADLAHLATADIAWVDVTAPGDGCAFALCDPVAVSGVAPATGKRWPLVISAAFTRTLSPERWRDLRWRFFRLHFQYLCAFDRPGDYDYFRITAGPLSLASRFAGRAPSKSRIETPVSKHRSTGP
ncbi:MAG: hypothetical protein CSA74_08430 [Rhodobacterales bacterium]|nr:MAG: hypothetical protein CSA74_08430 [Rhodobacterales bacterium]